MRISIYVPYHGVIEGITPAYRSFRVANDMLASLGRAPMFDVEYVGLDKVIQTQQGIYSIQTERLLKDVTRTDLLILPPLMGDLDVALQANQEAIPHIHRLFQQQSSVASLCIGAFLLAETGLLTGKPCSTHWAFMDELRRRYPQVDVRPGAVITAHGQLYSSGGAHNLWNLLLYLIEQYAGREIAVLLSKYFSLDFGRNDQSEFIIFQGQRAHHDLAILEAQQWIDKHFEQKCRVDELAAHMGMGRRTFERRFKAATHHTFIDYLQRVRMEAAKKWFESSRKNVSEVMYAVGYTDPKSFRDTFKKHTGLTPIAYRHKFAKTLSVKEGFTQDSNPFASA
jgi:transcriptional regulator GlxA family with amidase domain